MDVSLHVDQPTSCAFTSLSVDVVFWEKKLSKFFVQKKKLSKFYFSSGSIVKHETSQELVKLNGHSFANLDDLMEQYNSKKLQLESISGKHVQLLSAFKSSYYPLRQYHEKTGHLRKLITLSRERNGVLWGWNIIIKYNSAITG